MMFFSMRKACKKGKATGPYKSTSISFTILISSLITPDFMGALVYAGVI
tara:strand:- start:503 stop:649 length:147 start_codon:yes stop_codon:yes gene_type:complete